MSKLEKLSISLTPELASLVRSAVTGGDYASTSEVIREPLRDWKVKQKSPDINEVSAISSDSYNDPEIDDLYAEAVKFVTELREVSIPQIQRKFKIGYNRSSNIIESMEAAGIVSSAGSNGKRFVLASPPAM
jgi:S-DNA-T family DNA segregation ATPase FtsK/SpoIIIE